MTFIETFSKILLKIHVFIVNVYWKSPLRSLLKILSLGLYLKPHIRENLKPLQECSAMICQAINKLV